ncbi:hypothetical protein MYXO_01537 [Myxococcaceae bacterium]|nr:hypothetical protein MYXO_01537 [Myxococcaceae bacterium]
MQRIARGQITARTDAERIAASAHQYGEEFTFRTPLDEFAARIDRARADRNSKGVLHVVSRSGNSRYDQSPWDLSLERP